MRKKKFKNRKIIYIFNLLCFINKKVIINKQQLYLKKNHEKNSKMNKKE